MRDTITTTKCYTKGCGAMMKGEKGQYNYTESGLQSVYLTGILVFHCSKCNALIPEIPAVGVLNRVIALRLIRKKTLLSGSEIRFLRKLCGYSVNEFVEIMGASNKSVVSRWETHGTQGKEIDRIVRLLVMGRLIREVAGQTHPTLKSVSIEQLFAQIETSLKSIVAERNDIQERYDIGPEELAKFGGGCLDVAEPSEHEQLVSSSLQ